MSVQQPSVLPSDLYGYFIDLDERGSFLADVRDLDGKTVFEVRAGDSLGEDETSLIDDGFMRDTRDISGLTDYLRSMNVIPSHASVVTMQEFEQALLD